MDPQSLTILVGAFQRILSILIAGCWYISVIVFFSVCLPKADATVAAVSFPLAVEAK